MFEMRVFRYKKNNKTNLIVKYDLSWYTLFIFFEVCKLVLRLINRLFTPTRLFTLPLIRLECQKADKRNLKASLYFRISVSILSISLLSFVVFFNQALHLNTESSSKSIYSILYTSFIADYSHEIYINTHNQTPAQLDACRLPKLKLIGHTNVQRYVKCKQKHEWGHLDKNVWHFNKRIMSKFKSFNCKYRNLTRQNDFELVYSPYDTLVDGQLILSDVIEVLCFADHMKYKYDALHAQIVPKLALSNVTVKNAEENKTQKCEPLNILLLSYDSLSRVSWFRRLPLTTRFLLNEMKFDILYGQSIIGRILSNERWHFNTFFVNS